MRKNEMKLEFDSRSCNEGFARVAVAAFLTQLNPTLEEVADVKTAVSEAVTNVIIHAYDREEEKVLVHCWIEDETLWIEVIDHGRGIADVAQAMEPLYTTGGEERSGLGFSVMESFTDRLRVVSHKGRGTVVTMEKYIMLRERQARQD